MTQLGIGRQMFVRRALDAVMKVKGQGADWVSLGVAQGALEHVLEHWDEWAELEERLNNVSFDKGDDNGKENTGAEAGKPDCGLPLGVGGECAQDVSGGNGHGHGNNAGEDKEVKGVGSGGSAHGKLFHFPIVSVGLVTMIGGFFA